MPPASWYTDTHSEREKLFEKHFHGFCPLGRSQKWPLTGIPAVGIVRWIGVLTFKQFFWPGSRAGVSYQRCAPARPGAAAPSCSYCPLSFGLPPSVFLGSTILYQLIVGAHSVADKLRFFDFATCKGTVPRYSSRASNSSQFLLHACM